MYSFAHVHRWPSRRVGPSTPMFTTSSDRPIVSTESDHHGTTGMCANYYNRHDILSDELTDSYVDSEVSSSEQESRAVEGSDASHVRDKAFRKKHCSICSKQFWNFKYAYFNSNFMALLKTLQKNAVLMYAKVTANNLQTLVNR